MQISFLPLVFVMLSFLSCLFLFLDCVMLLRIGLLNGLILKRAIWFFCYWGGTLLRLLFYPLNEILMFLSKINCVMLQWKGLLSGLVLNRALVLLFCGGTPLFIFFLRLFDNIPLIKIWEPDKVILRHSKIGLNTDSTKLHFLFLVLSAIFLALSANEQYELSIHMKKTKKKI